jgi:hypothetical protein
MQVYTFFIQIPNSARLLVFIPSARPIALFEIAISIANYKPLLKSIAIIRLLDEAERSVRFPSSNQGVKLRRQIIRSRPNVVRVEMTD